MGKQGLTGGQKGLSVNFSSATYGMTLGILLAFFFFFSSSQPQACHLYKEYDRHSHSLALVFVCVILDCRSETCGLEYKFCKHKALLSSPLLNPLGLGLWGSKDGHKGLVILPIQM